MTSLRQGGQHLEETSRQPKHLTIVPEPHVLGQAVVTIAAGGESRTRARARHILAPMPIVRTRRPCVSGLGYRVRRWADAGPAAHDEPVVQRSSRRRRAADAVGVNARWLGTDNADMAYDSPGCVVCRHAEDLASEVLEGEHD